MAYTDFTLSDLEEKFGIKHERKRLDFNPALLMPSERLKEELEESIEMPIYSHCLFCY